VRRFFLYFRKLFFATLLSVGFGFLFVTVSAFHHTVPQRWTGHNRKSVLPDLLQLHPARTDWSACLSRFNAFHHLFNSWLTHLHGLFKDMFIQYIHGYFTFFQSVLLLTVRLFLVLQFL